MTLPIKPSRRSIVALSNTALVLALALTSIYPAKASNETWSGGGGSANTNWSDTANWSTNIVPGSTTLTTNADVALFSAAVTGSNTGVVTIDSTTQNIGGLTFSASGNYRIGGTTANAGNSLLLSSTGSISLTGGTSVIQTVNAPLVLEAGAGGTGSYTINSNDGTGTLDINGNITTAATGAYALTLTGGGTTQNTVAGIISDGTSAGLALAKTGAGLWILSGTNSYSGGTTVSAGTLQIASDANLGAAPTSATAGNIVLANGILSVVNGTTTVTLNSNRGIALGTANGTSTTGTLSAGGSGGAATTLVYGGIIANNDASAADALSLTGSGTISLTGNNTYTGGTTSNVNFLMFSNDSNFGASSGSLTFTGNHDLITTANITTNRTIQLGNSATTSAGMIAVIAAGTTFTVSGNIVNGNASITGVTVGSGGFTSNTGTLKLTGDNTYTGTTALNVGSLDVDGNSNALGLSALSMGNLATGQAFTNSSTTAVTLNNNVELSAATSTAYFSGVGNISFSGNDFVNTGPGLTTGASVIYTGSADLTFGGASGDTFALTNSTAGTDDVFNFKSSTGTIDISNSIINDTVSMSTEVASLVWGGSGVGTLILSGNNTYAGTTSLSGGTVVISGTNSTTGNISIGTSTALDINSNGALGSSELVIGGGDTLDNTSGSSVSVTGNAVSLSSATLTYGGTGNLALGPVTTVTNSTADTIDLNGSAGLSFASFVNGNTSASPSFTLTVNGSGNTLTLGSFTLSSTATAATDVVTGTGNVNIGAIGNGPSATTGSFSYTGSGTATLSGNNTLTGTLLANSTGKVILSGDNSSETGTVSLTKGELDLNNAHALSNTTTNIFGSTGGTTAVTLDNTSGGALMESLNPNINLYQVLNFTGTNNLNLGSGTVTYETASNGINLNGTNSTLSIGTFSVASATDGMVNFNSSSATNTLSIGALNLNTSTSVKNLTINGSGGANITVGSISGGNSADTLNYNGSGVFTLTGAASYKGGTQLNNGLFYLGASATMAAPTSATATNIVINNGGSLGGLGTVSGNVVLQFNGEINLVDNTIGTLTLGALSSSGGGTLAFEIGAGSTGTDKIALGATGNTLDITDVTTINVENLNNASSESINTGTYTLISYAGTQQSLSNFVFENGLGSTTLDGDTLTLAQTGDVISVVVAAPVSTFYYTGAGGTDFSTGANYSTTISGGTAQTGTLSSNSDVFISANSPSSSGPVVNTATTIDSLTFNSNGAGTTVSGTAPITVLGTNNSGVGIADQTVGSTTETISAPVILGASQTWSANANTKLVVSGQVSGTGYSLNKAGSGVLVLSHAVGNTYTGGTTVTAGTLYADGGVSGSSSATGSGAVTVNGGTLAGKGAISTSAGLMVNTGGTLASGDAQTATTVDGTHLSIFNTSVTIASANLTFDLGAGTTTNAGYHTFATPNTNTTYLSLTGSTMLSFTGTDSISLVDLTNTTGTNGSLSLRLGTPYLLVGAASNADYLNLVINSGTAANPIYSLSQNDSLVNGYVIGVYSGSGLVDAADSTPISISQYGSDGVTPLTVGANGIYPAPVLYLDGGQLEVVPEPGTWALMISGLVSLIMFQRIRYKNVADAGADKKGRGMKLPT